MKRLIQLFSIIAIAISVLTLSATAGDLKLGISVNYGNNSHSNTEVPWPTSCSCVGDASSGRGYFLGLVAEFFEDIIFDDVMVLRIGVQTMPMKDNAKITYDLETMVGGTPQTVKTTCNYGIASELNSATLDFMYKVNIVTTGFAFSIGPTINYFYDTNLKTELTILDPENALFPESNSKIKQYTDGKVPEANEYRIGLKAGLQYDINLDIFKIALGVFYDHGFTDFTKNGWNVNNLLFGLDAMINL